MNRVDSSRIIQNALRCSSLTAVNMGLAGSTSMLMCTTALLTAIPIFLTRAKRAASLDEGLLIPAFAWAVFSNSDACSFLYIHVSFTLIPSNAYIQRYSRS